ncbi:MAG: putative transporter transrane protein [Acidimicrobiales bacterium]|nr:putative transporter transrane protein [Acidimicrobiales bacterium]
MTTTISPPRSPNPPVPSAATPTPTRSGLDARGILASEWTKLRSVRSTWWTLVSTLGMMAGFSALLSAAFVSRYDHLDAFEKATFDPTLHSLRGMYLAQLAIGVLGVLVISNEYTTGMIRNSFMAVPQRPAVLAAKAAVFGAIAFVVSEIASFAAFFIGQAILSQKHVQASIGDPGVLRAVIGAGVYLTGVGLLGLGLGALLRRTAGAIASLFGLVLVFPVLAEALPSPWNRNVSKVLPGGAGQAFAQVRRTSDALSPWTGLALFVGYIAVTAIAAVIFVNRRDA